MSLRFKIFTGYIIICLLWGSSWAAVKLGIDDFPFLLSLALRFTVGSIILGIMIVVNKLGIPKDKNFWMLVIILCITSFMVPFAMIYWAQIYMSSSLAAILFATFSFWVAILSHLFLPNEKISFVRIIGLIIGFLGLVIIFYDGVLDIDKSKFYGMIMTVIAAIIQAISLIALRKSSKYMNHISLTFWPMLLSIIPLFLVSVFIEDYSSAHFSYKTIGSILYLSIFCTVITFVIYFWLAKHTEAIILSLSAFITPVIAILIGALYMNDNIASNIYYGSAFVLIGVVVVTIGNRVRINMNRVNNE